MLDYEYAHEAFLKYLKEYDCEDEKTQLKIVHTYGVVHCVEVLGTKMNLSEEEMELAKVIALLHDIGRFEQVKLHDQFDDGVMDHADFSIQVLFRQRRINEFVKSRKYDLIIRQAIANHNKYAIAPGLQDRTLLHAKLIRDADKLDNFRVRLAEKIENLIYQIPSEELGSYPISDTIYSDFKSRQCILSAKTNTPMDMWVSYIAQIFDVNFKETFQLIKEKEYIHKTADRIPYTNPETARKMEEIIAIADAFVEEQCRKGEDE
ncbi:MAG: HD domain-containing protein [Lachnospiraceae bacterium]|nr:HD domain-containing protein [Lachnospiraceae bacterium]